MSAGTRTVALATCADLPEGDEDALALVESLAALGVAARWQVWDDPSADWGAGLTVIRSTWDYTPVRAKFVKWARSVPRLANVADIVEWNSDKVYLRDLASDGVPIVPTRWAAPGEVVTLPRAGEFVVKPSVGAGSRGAGRFVAGADSAALDHAARLHDAGRVVLVQPYLADVDTSGETALIYLDGNFSHAVQKGAMLPRGVTHPVDGHDLYVEERIEAHVPGADELEVGTRALDAVRRRFGADPLYARVDLLPSSEGPVVIEFELTEPSLFLGYSDGAADRFAAAIAAQLGDP
jgi:glutathione synthase/RimK-type ligase-like ATP-grasp enzyme